MDNKNNFQIFNLYVIMTHKNKCLDYRSLIDIILNYKCKHMDVFYGISSFMIFIHL